MRSRNTQYLTLDQLNYERESISWYWRLIALASSWMILGGYLILPSTYDTNPQLRFSKGVLSIFIVALLTAGYSFTGLLCFACRSWMFQAEAVFLPSLASSALGLLTVLWNFISSERYTWNTAAIVATVLTSLSCVFYGLLLLWTNRKISQVRKACHSRSSSILKDPGYYSNYSANMAPSVRSASYAPPPPTDDDLVSQQMAMLLAKNDPRPSPEASQSTFRIDLPGLDGDGDREDDMLPHPENVHGSPGNRGRSQSLTADRSFWERRLRGDDRGRPWGRNSQRDGRPMSREERRREIELGHIS